MNEKEERRKVGRVKWLGGPTLAPNGPFCRSVKRISNGYTFSELPKSVLYMVFFDVLTDYIYLVYAHNRACFRDRLPLISSLFLFIIFVVFFL